MVSARCGKSAWLSIDERSLEALVVATVHTWIRKAPRAAVVRERPQAWASVPVVLYSLRGGAGWGGAVGNLLCRPCNWGYLQWACEWTAPLPSKL